MDFRKSGHICFVLRKEIYSILDILPVLFSIECSAIAAHISHATEHARTYIKYGINQLFHLSA